MHRAVMPKIGTAQAWRDAARQFLAAGIPPEAILWGDTSTAPDLFGGASPVQTGGQVTVPRSFISMASSVVWHSDPERFARLYAFLWRLKDAPQLMTDRGDADLSRLRRMEKNVHRCQHKMKAFVRFREIGAPDAPRRSFAAWFEPTYHTVEPTADFFLRRFSDMDWRILTPDVCAIFEGGKLTFHEGREKPALPEDASEQLWITYFQNIFNPARLMVKAMQSEMPKKYWKNMPEAALIPELVAGAQNREAQMVDKGKSLFADGLEDRPDTLAAIDKAIHACRKCPIGQLDNHAVMGEGPDDAALMIVGEQPGDQEDLAGRPFVGPAGQLLDVHLEKAGIDRRGAYVTNTVKHFKYVQRGKRRLHQNPGAKEIDTCRWWIESERAIVQPKLVLAMGASAARGMLGKTVSITKARGRPIPLEDGSELWVTAHPSYLLRLDGPAREEQARLFDADLAAVRTRLAELAAP